MEIKFQKIKLSELSEFTASEEYKSLNNKPVSEERIQSYLHNPQAKPDDYVLYLLSQEKTLVAYRTLLPDNYGEASIHFAWCSGNYVNPEFRRQGLSRKLLDEALKDWNNKLMYTNYAPESHALYQKTGIFRNISSREGGTFYLKFSTKELLKHRIPSYLKWTLPLLDIGVRILAGLKLLFWKSKTLTNNFELLDFPSLNILKRFQKRETSGFIRNSEALQWILHYPWISQGEKQQEYFFSHSAKEFYYKFIEIGEKGFAILQYRDGKLKIPYFSVSDKEIKDLAAFIINWSTDHKISQFTTWDKNLYREISNQKNPFLYQKSKTQNVFASWDIKPAKPVCHDGTGDYIFT